VSGSFQAWKAVAMVRLLAIKAKYKGNQKVANDVDALVSRLERLRLDGLPAFIAMLNAAAVDAPEFLEIVPKEEEVEEWFKRGEEE